MTNMRYIASEETFKIKNNNKNLSPLMSLAENQSAHACDEPPETGVELEKQ